MKSMLAAVVAVAGEEVVAEAAGRARAVVSRRRRLDQPHQRLGQRKQLGRRHLLRGQLLQQLAPRPAQEPEISLKAARGPAPQRAKARARPSDQPVELPETSRLAGQRRVS